MNAYPPNNLHIHTPHSFSCFSSVAEAIKQAKRECIQVLGISDFYTVEGYPEFHSLCLEAGVFPVHGLEVMVFSPSEKRKGRLWNDPHNPGRIYLCGKGCAYPVKLGGLEKDILRRVKETSQMRIKEMIARLNSYLEKRRIPVRLDYSQLEESTPSGWVRERHIAKALYEKINSSEEKEGLLASLCSGYSSEEDKNSALWQGRLRDNLLKAGKVAYVEENLQAFLSWEESKQLFLALGGIPVYPVLADGVGQSTEIESNPQALAHTLQEMGIYVAEFIPHRNNISVLRECVQVLSEAGLILTAGSEHNTPQGMPLIPMARDSQRLDEKLQEKFWEGCCIIVAHEYLKSLGKEGFVDQKGDRTRVSRGELKEIGEQQLQQFWKS